MTTKYIASSIIMILLLIITFTFYTESRKEWRENSWQRTKCTIVQSQMVKSSSNSPASAMGSVIRFCPKITCRYNAFGKERENILTEQDETPIAFRSRNEAMEFSKQYKEGTEQYIYFKTVSPDICTPNPNRTENPVRMIIAGLFFLITIYIAIRTFRKIHKKIKSAS